MQAARQLVLDFLGIAPGPEEGPAAGPAPVAAPQAASAPLEHPQANRQVVLEGLRVAYVLRRARRRSIGFRVDGDGLSVRAPASASVGAIEAALQAKAGWIVRKLAEQGEWQRRLEGARIDWKEGAVLPYLGEPLAIVLDPAHRVAGAGAR
ncbi:YgjP-like metallopeptidase domain-containing protein, partial [Melaminivora alkalimesophila]